MRLFHPSLKILPFGFLGVIASSTSAQSHLDDFYGLSLPCNVNVACTEGTPWTSEIRSTLRLVYADADSTDKGCTGTLINNTNEDLMPLVLTANHCINVAADNSTTPIWFQFEWQTPGCTNPQSTPVFEYLLTTADVLARGTGGGGGAGDFSLLMLSSDLPLGLEVHFAGWSRAVRTPQRGVILSHPEGDVKKIAIDTDPVASIGTTHWGTTLELGAPATGTSGAALFDDLHQIVGHISVAGAACQPYAAFANGPKLEWYWDSTTPTLGSKLDGAGGGTAVSLPSIANYDLIVSGETFSDPVNDVAAGFFRTATAISATDNTLESGGRLHFRARESITISGDFLSESGGNFLARIEAASGSSGGSGNVRFVDESVALPEAPRLASNYPNPFGRWTTFQFSIPTADDVSLIIYDILGREVARLFDGPHESGEVTLHWNPTTAVGEPLASGTYLYRLRVGEQTQTRTLTIIR